MSDFIDVTKYLDKGPVRVASYSEALNANIPFDKFYGKVATRAIKKLFWFIQLQPNQVIQPLTSRLLWQYNITFPQPFYILGVTGIPSIVKLGHGLAGGGQMVVTVKWRKGTTVYRYCIANNFAKGPITYFFNGHFQGLTAFPIVSFPDYKNQVIPQNCVIEIWSALTSTSANTMFTTGFTSPINIQTSLMSDPITADDVAVIFGSGLPLGLANIGVNLPENLPYNQPTIVWNDNP